MPKPTGVPPLKKDATLLPRTEVEALQQLLACAGSRVTAVTGEAEPLRDTLDAYIAGTTHAMNAMWRDVKAVLLDVRGVVVAPDTADRLGDYALAHVEEFLNQHYGDDEVQETIHRMRVVARWDVELRPCVPKIRGSGSPCDDRAMVISDVVANYTFNAKANRKIPAFKDLQGQILRAGYHKGDITVTLLPDTLSALQRWSSRGVAVYVYSSASAAAQRLLFSHCTGGDVSAYITGHFDTQVGSKHDAESYHHIAGSVGLPPAKVLFVTKTASEALAARDAGMQAVIVHRVGNPPVPAELQDAACVLPQTTSFDEILCGSPGGGRRVSGRRRSAEQAGLDDDKDAREQRVAG